MAWCKFGSIAYSRQCRRVSSLCERMQGGNR